jgi:hypothetical protein
MVDVEISVGSSAEFENLTAEVRFGSAIGVIVSKEPGDQEYMLSIYSLSEESQEKFGFNKNINDDKVSYKVFSESVNEAINRLKGLGETVD